VRKKPDEHYRLEEELRLGAARHRLATEAAGIGFWEWEPRLGRLFWDERCRKILGVPESASSDFPLFLDLLHPDDRERVTNEAKRSEETGEEYDSEYRIVRPSGEIRWVHALGRRYGTAPGATMYGLVLDVTKRRNAEEQVRRQAALLDTTYDAIIVRDEGCRVLFWNRGAEEMYGWSSQEVKGKVTHVLFEAVYPLPLEEALAELHRTGRWEGEVVHRKKTGEKVTVLARWTLCREGETVTVLEINTDISARKEAEEELREREGELRRSRKLFQSIIDIAPIPIAYLDPEERYMLANRAYAEMLGTVQEKIVGRTIREVLPEYLFEQIHPKYYIAACGGFSRFEVEVVPPGTMPATGTVRRYVKMCVPAVDEEGRVTGVVSTHSDITDLKESERNLLQAKEAAEAASRAKSEFLANMSHEMRTPLAGVLGMIELVLDTELGEEQRRLLALAEKSARTLLRLISDILEFSRTEAGKMLFTPKPFDIRECVSASVELLARQATEKGVRLFHTVDDDVPSSFYGDEGRLRQILVNLVGNAVKFTHEGEIEVAVRRDRDADDPSREFLSFSVRDTGIGIAPEKIPSLFRLFSQVDASTTRRYGGTGLGLALSRRLVEQMGGTIRVESRVGEGSVFTFILPLEWGRGSEATEAPVREGDPQAERERGKGEGE
jgi:two-component system, sensor histidine kinase and response regulator